MPDAPVIAEMFGDIVPRYDLANHVLSLGLDFRWRRRLVESVAQSLPQPLPNDRPCLVLDLATGSGDVAFALKQGLDPAITVHGADFCGPMLAEAERKKQARPWAKDITFTFADCLAPPFPNEFADAITIAFGLRNLADRPRALQEMRRILRPGASLFVLEFSRPVDWFCPPYYFYLRHILPRLGGLITGHPAAYRYLTASIADFPGRDALDGEFRAAGFAKVRHLALALGAVALHQATK